VNANFNFDHLAFERTPEPRGSADIGPWSDRPFELAFLRVFDGVAKVSVGELSVQKIRVAPGELEANLAGGLLSLVLSRADLYGGPIQAKLVVDAGSSTPRHAASIDFAKVNARQLLADAASFEYLEGSLRAKADVQATGASPQAIVSSLSGTADLTLEDGAIRDIDVSAMVRALMSQALHGWQDKGQERAKEKTELTMLSAKFRLNNGQATTDDVRLAGPLVRMTGKGTADVAAQTLDFRVDPKLVLTLQGQGATGATGDPAGLGVPVAIRGTWSNPEIYPEIAGILDNPTAAFDQLRKMGGALFGPGKKPSTDEVIKSVDDLIRGRNQPGQSGRQPSLQDRGNQVRDMLKDLLGR
jgi:AsmA protein